MPTELRARLQAEATRRGMKLSPALRAILQERVEELDDLAQLTRAEEWQRAEAWAAWERFKAGDRDEASKEQVDAELDDARRQMAARRSA